MARIAETLEEKEVMGFASSKMRTGTGKMVIAIVGLVIGFAQAILAGEARAAEVLKDYEREAAAFQRQLEAAPDIDAQRRVWAAAPSSDAFGRKLFNELNGSWNQPWFLDYAPALLEKAPAYSIKLVEGAQTRTPLNLIREASEKFHFADERIGRVALSLTIDTGPKTRAFLEKIEATHPSKKVQGQAAMALALLSRELGDGGGVAQFKAQRLDWVRKAIIESNDVAYNGTTVGKLAEDFLFEIMKLEKGMQAPDLLGWNISREAMRLSDFEGKPVVVVFWHSRMEAAEETLAFMRKLEARLGPKGVAVLGVAAESSLVLREMVKSGNVTWRNWVDDQGKLSAEYRVRSFPSAWVLDGERKVQYRGVPGAFVELTAEALVK